MTRGAWRVGTLAGRTGVSVRALHYYDEIGLLSPSARSPTGHRLYDAADIVRLQQIRSLRHLGFSLKEIADRLRHSDASPKEVIAAHRSRVKAQIRELNDLDGRLQTLEATVDLAEDVSVDALLGVIEMTSKIEQHYSPKQRDQLARRRQTVGDDRIREVEAEWPVLIEQVRHEMKRGTDPGEPRVRMLARRWSDLVQEFTGGDPGIQKSLGAMWRQGDAVHGMETAAMRELGDYLARSAESSSKGK